MITQNFVTAETALSDIKNGFKEHPDVRSGELRNAEAKIVTNEVDEWLIHITAKAPRFSFFGVQFGTQQINVWVKGNKQHRRYGSLICTGDHIGQGDEAGAIYSIWEVPDCIYLANGLTYDILLKCLRGHGPGH